MLRFLAAHRDRLLLLNTILVFWLIWYTTSSPTLSPLAPPTLIPEEPSPEDPLCARQLLIVVPFTPQKLEKDSQKYIKDLTRYAWCEPQKWKYASCVTLVYQIATNYTKEALALAESIPFFPNCVGKRLFWENNVPDKFNNHDSGSGHQFYSLFKDPKAEGYDYWFLMEMDLMPLRPRWIERLYQETLDVSTFWVKGGFGAGYGCMPPDNTPDCFEKNALPPEYGYQKKHCNIHTWHLNGNAIYRLGDPVFNDLLETVNAKHGYWSFDMALPLLICEGRVDLFYVVLTKYRFSNLIAQVDRASEPAKQHFIKSIQDNTNTETYFSHKFYYNGIDP